MSSTLCADAPFPKKKTGEGDIHYLEFFFFFFFEGREHLYTGSVSSSQSEEQMYMKLVQPPPLIPWGRGGGIQHFNRERESYSRL